MKPNTFKIVRGENDKGEEFFFIKFPDSNDGYISDRESLEKIYNAIGLALGRFLNET